MRYRGLNGPYGNGAEIEFHRGGLRMIKTGYGTPGSWKNREATFWKALDTDINTYFDGLPWASTRELRLNSSTPKNTDTLIAGVSWKPRRRHAAADLFLTFGA